MEETIYNALASATGSNSSAAIKVGISYKCQTFLFEFSF